MRKYLILISTLFFSNFIHAQTWEQAISKDGITVWTRNVKGSEYREFKGEIIIDGNLNNILSVIDDISTYPKWVHNCIEAKQIKRNSNSRGIRYTAIKSPWPISDRDVVFEYTVSHNQTTKTINIKLVAIKGDISDKGRVRITNMSSSYELTPLSKNKTKVVYQSHLDPTGHIPTSIFNQTITDTPYYTLLKLRQVVTSGNYKKQIFKEITE